MGIDKGENSMKRFLKRVLVVIMLMGSIILHAPAVNAASTAPNTILKDSLIIINKDGYEIASAYQDDRIGIQFEVQNYDTSGLSAGDTFSLELPSTIKAISSFTGEIWMSGQKIATYSCTDLSTIVFTYEAAITSVPAYMATITIRNLEMQNLTSGSNTFDFVLNENPSDIITKTLNITLIDRPVVPPLPPGPAVLFSKAGRGWSALIASGSGWETKYPLNDPINKYYYMRWELTINYNESAVSRMENIVISDVIQYGAFNTSTCGIYTCAEHFLLEDSLIIVAMEIVSRGPTVAEPRASLVKGVDYTLDISADLQHFTITFIDSSPNVEPEYFYWVNYLTKRNDIEDTTLGYTNSASISYHDPDTSADEVINAWYNNHYTSSGTDISSRAMIKATTKFNSNALTGLKYEITKSGDPAGTIGNRPTDVVLTTVSSDFLSPDTYVVTVVPSSIPAGYYFAPGEDTKTVTLAPGDIESLEFAVLRSAYNVYYYDTDTSIHSNVESVYHGELASGYTAATIAGKTFVGWYIDLGLVNVYNFSNPVISDLRLYARYDTDVYTVKFWDGTTELTTLEQSRTYGQFVTVPTAPAKAGYVFGGWYTDATLTVPFNFTSVVIADTNVYGKWTVTVPAGTTPPATGVDQTLNSYIIVLTLSIIGIVALRNMGRKQTED